MKRKFFAFIALITATLSLSSCLSSDETTVEYTHDTAITAFSLGSLDRYTKTKAGKDTLLKANVTGSDYKFYIDQAQRKIYNVDSLPCGVRDSAILATISSKNSSPILLMDINKTDSVAAYYSSSDSINFSKPRFIRVYSGDYSAYAEYKVTVNVHKELPYEFKWHELAQNNSQLAAFSDLKAVACGDDIYVFGKTAEGTKVLKSAINDGSAWSSIMMNVSLSSDAYQSAVALDGKLYIADGGKVYASADAATWKVVSENPDIKQLIGASSKYLYAYTATAAGISVSKDQGASWEQEKLDTDADSLPTQNISMNVAGVLSAKNVENVMLMGTRNKALNDTITTWLRTVDYDENAEAGQWNYLEIEKNQSGKMPCLDQVITCAADTGFVALGSNGKWYKSQDAGLTWTQDKKVALPDEFGTAGRFAFCRDKQHYYWIIRNGYVWRGRFNIDGWSKKED
ncbi:DUF6242 domain-containing protein [Segatella copri]|uniref:BNR/Asp-box repeat protein n=1 Tax=Segatella copri TaxID=165179 RepID=A0AAW9T8X4_9BACT|nr:DUF6242 domain-containing protein [Segatella copri]MQN26360.1 hypothetical protein [Segatella copri]MQN32472.1 hypothetical protein [Segatella copri]MQN36226.1 hypothetical protein [Segatella copri]MQN73792.1 hypothetical protein [Segatella copri]MQO25920.1 hypothetical protein [Segatella copri]